MISNLDQNIFFWDSSAETFTEYTKELNNYDSGSVTMTFNSGDRLYFATSLPFNHRYFGITQPNTASATNLIIEYYGGSAWRLPSRILDYTESTIGATFGKSGILQFIPDNKYLIDQQSDTDVMDDNFKDHAPRVYDMFWLGIGFDSTTTIGLNYAGQLFTGDDAQIYSKYPLLNESRYLDQWESGKTDWEKQRVEATEEVIRELKRRSVIIGRDQVLDTASLNEACIHQTAQMMFSGLGAERFPKEIQLSGERYSTAMNMERYKVDKNADALLDGRERVARASLRSR